jgi:hypothetical protein
MNAATDRPATDPDPRYRLPDDYTRCHDNGCEERYSCLRYLCRGADYCGPRTSHTASLMDWDHDAQRCRGMIEATEQDACRAASGAVQQECSGGGRR